MQIEKVKYSHLTQLKDCDEGHHLEFKLLLEDGGKAQLAKEITSFANCEGGWLIVGVDDKTKELKPIDKQDYSQRVGKIATRISPMPEFNTRFLTLPNDKKKGVLIIYVHEGKNAPYICNGSIYVRSGSSKEPVKAADRGNVEYLYERTRSYKKDVSVFCLVKLFHDIAKEYKLKEKDYAFCVEVENAGGVVPAFYGEEYKEYVLAYGVPYAHKERNRSQIYYFRDFTKVTFETLVDTLIADDFCATLGIRSDSIFKIMQDANKRYIKS